MISVFTWKPSLHTGSFLDLARTASVAYNKRNRPFYRYGDHIEFIGFKEYYGMPRGQSLSIYARFSGKKRTSLYISREKGDHYYIQTRHDDLFFPLPSFYIESCSCPPGHPIILLKSKKFNMAAVSVKRSILEVGCIDFHIQNLQVSFQKHY